MTQSIPEPPTDVLEPIVPALIERSDREWRANIHDAQQCLWEQPPQTDAIDAREGEWAVQIDEHDASTSVIVEPTNATNDRRRSGWPSLGRVADQRGA